jgi:hypothetical protein
MKRKAVEVSVGQITLSCLITVQAWGVVFMNTHTSKHEITLIVFTYPFLTGGGGGWRRIWRQEGRVCRPFALFEQAVCSVSLVCLATL